MILRFLFFIQTFLKHCKALSTEKNKHYINILLSLLLAWRILYLAQRPSNNKIKEKQKLELHCAPKFPLRYEMLLF